MSITTEKTQELVAKFQKKPGDTGSTEVQVAILTERIRNLTLHMQEHKHDYHSLHGLMCLVGKRRKLLRYLKNADFSRYSTVIKALDLRK